MKETTGKIETHAVDPEMAKKIGETILRVIDPLLFSITGYEQHPTKKAIKILRCEFIGTVKEEYFKKENEQ